MDATDLVDAVREANKTELSRLGSSKSLYADTEGEMEPEAVLAAMADATHSLHETAAGWATTDDGQADTYEAVAAVAADHHDDVAAKLDTHEPGERPAGLETLAGFEDPSSRLGGLLGWTLVAGEKAGQATGFFTGQADPRTASLFRGMGEDYETLRADLVDALAAGSTDLNDAQAAADAVVGAAYDTYVDRLEAMGVNPKPVC